MDFVFRHDERRLREEKTEEGPINGEMVRDAVERWTWVQSGRAVVSGLGFAMGVVGVWGDGA